LWECNFESLFAISLLRISIQGLKTPRQSLVNIHIRMKAELPLHRIDIAALATAIDETQTTVKLALKGGQRDPHEGLSAIRTTSDAKKFFLRAAKRKNAARLIEIALRGINLSATLEELRHFRFVIENSQPPGWDLNSLLDIRAAFVLRFRGLWPAVRDSAKSFNDAWKWYCFIKDVDSFPELECVMLVRAVSLATDPEEITVLVRVEQVGNDIERILLRRACSLASSEQVAVMLKQGDIEERHGEVFQLAICQASQAFEKK
jgi:hypothetical protein